MAVTSATSSISYTGNASTVTSYAVPFLFLENSHLSAIAKVIATGVETVVTLTNHTGTGDISGGTVRTAVAVPATSTLTISRTVPATQTTSYAEGGDFPAASHERALDKLTMLGQQIARSISRTVRLSDAAPETSPLPVLPNRFFGTDNTGAIALVTGTDAPAGTLTDANVASDAAIALSKLATGALPTGITVASANLVNGTIVDADIDAAAAIAYGKLDLDDSIVTGDLTDDAVTTAKIDNGAVIPTKLSQPFTQTAAVPTTSGSLIDFTAIPSWVKRITVAMNQVSTNGTSAVIIQLGDSGGIEATDYIGTGTAITATPTYGISSFTTGFSAGTGALATSSRSGVVSIVNVGGNTWVASGTLTTLAGASFSASHTQGVKVLSATLDTVRVTTINGSDEFDNGSISLIYEG
jgi:hypothetical protein